MKKLYTTEEMREFVVNLNRENFDMFLSEILKYWSQSQYDYDYDREKAILNITDFFKIITEIRSTSL